MLISRPEMHVSDMKIIKLLTVCQHKSDSCQQLNRKICKKTLANMQSCSRSKKKNKKWNDDIMQTREKAYTEVANK